MSMQQWWLLHGQLSYRISCCFAENNFNGPMTMSAVQVTLVAYICWGYHFRKVRKFDSLNPWWINQWDIIICSITHHPSPIIHHPSPITHHTPSIIHHPSPITSYPSSSTHRHQSQCFLTKALGRGVSQECLSLWRPQLPQLAWTIGTDLWRHKNTGEKPGEC